MQLKNEEVNAVNSITSALIPYDLQSGSNIAKVRNNLEFKEKLSK